MPVAGGLAAGWAPLTQASVEPPALVPGRAREHASAARIQTSPAVVRPRATTRGRTPRHGWEWRPDAVTDVGCGGTSSPCIHPPAPSASPEEGAGPRPIRSALRSGGAGTPPAAHGSSTAADAGRGSRPCAGSAGPRLGQDDHDRGGQERDPGAGRRTSPRRSGHCGLGIVALTSIASPTTGPPACDGRRPVQDTIQILQQP